MFTHTMDEDDLFDSMYTTEAYGWGNSANGQLGLEFYRESPILKPLKLPRVMNGNIVQVACGRYHTLFLNSHGRVYSCGSNSHGQLGHELMELTPTPVEGLDGQEIQRIECGSCHSLALTVWGKVYSWGNNEYGQLGRSDPDELSPKIIKGLGAKVVVQIASGINHNLALTIENELYAWGSNVYGQIGVGQDCVYAPTPLLVAALRAVPLLKIVCGGYHSFAISTSSAVFGWGRNTCGQLGVHDYVNRRYPTLVKFLRNLEVKYIACGDEFSVFLTMKGQVFTCGNGKYGQLGHGVTEMETFPRIVIGLTGCEITQIACGACHTLAFEGCQGRLFAFGLGCVGQLGACGKENVYHPEIIKGPWANIQDIFRNIQMNANSNGGHIQTIHQIFAGGDHSIVTTTLNPQLTLPIDYRINYRKGEIKSFTLELARECARTRPEAEISWDLFMDLETIFSSVGCLNGSFLHANKRRCCSAYQPGVNLRRASAAFRCLGKAKNPTIQSVIREKISNEILGTLTTSPSDMEAMRIFMLLPLYREFNLLQNASRIQGPYAMAVFSLEDPALKILILWWSRASENYFRRLVYVFKNMAAGFIANSVHTTEATIHRRLRQSVRFDQNLALALDMLSLLYRINSAHRDDKTPDNVFHWDSLVDFADIQHDYVNWLFDGRPDVFNICNYPFLFNATTKTTLLQTDQAMQMHDAMQNSLHVNPDVLLSYLVMPSPYGHFLTIMVDRKNIMQDTLREIMKHDQNDLKKPLRIRFCNEEAEDAGGLRKEFFLLLLKDMFDAKYGMFKDYEESRCVWFSETTFESEAMYFLIGVICGLAIYNFTIINLPFPLALYKKILNEPVDITDLADLSPQMARSMREILDYEGNDFVDVFDLRFEIIRDNLGRLEQVPLKPNGHNIAVTQENKEEFVDLYIDYMLNKSVKCQFDAFKRGFIKVCWGRVLQLFRPAELMAVVVGNEHYDWRVFETNCEYKNGYSAESQVVKWFWEVFHQFSLADKKKFLLFLTGSDRIPIQGMKAVKIFIQATNDDRYLPVAHTCFNLLDLPRYRSKQVVKHKLMCAIQQTEGFNLV